MRPHDPHFRGRLLARALDDGPEPASAVVAFARGKEPAVLESVVGHESHGRWSLFACDPVDVLVVEQHHCGDPFEVLATKLARYPSVENSSALPFAGGWIG